MGNSYSEKNYQWMFFRYWMFNMMRKHGSLFKWAILLHITLVYSWNNWFQFLWRLIFNMKLLENPCFLKCSHLGTQKNYSLFKNADRIFWDKIMPGCEEQVQSVNRNTAFWDTEKYWIMQLIRHLFELETKRFRDSKLYHNTWATLDYL